jgi:hypothetical protein
MRRTPAPLRKAAPLPMAATIAVATNGPMPGICLSRWQAGSDEAICSTSSLMATTYCVSAWTSMPRNRKFSFMTGSLPLVALNCGSMRTHSLTHAQRIAPVTLQKLDSRMRKGCQAEMEFGGFS